MDDIALEKFYETIQDKNNLDTAQSIRSMLNDLPSYMANRIQDKYKNEFTPFEKIWRNKNIDVVFEKCMIDNNYFKLDIWCNENGYIVHLWNPENVDFDIIDYFKDIELLNAFTLYDGKKYDMEKHFEMNQEEDLFKFINNLRVELRRLQVK